MNELSDIPGGVVGPLIALVLAVDVVVLLELRRREVTGLPKIAWALIILFVTFPVGALLYWFGGRVPPEEESSTRSTGDPTGAPAPGFAVSTDDTGPGAPATWTPDGAVVVATHDLRKVYDVAAVDGVDLRVPAGAIYGLIGPNGAGKTTLMEPPGED